MSQETKAFLGLGIALSLVGALITVGMVVGLDRKNSL